MRGAYIIAALPEISTRDLRQTENPIPARVKNPPEEPQGPS